jgi:amidase
MPPVSPRSSGTGRCAAASSSSSTSTGSRGTTGSCARWRPSTPTAPATADERDREVAAGRLRGPLHGVPVTVKDAFTVAGVRSTSGMADLADHVPSTDAVAVARLRGAGAVVLGKTTCPSGVTGQETASALFGRTNNPWDRSRTPGGSSGGAAAALAAGLTALDVGSDHGGSIRQPASYCGVFGHVATHGLVPPTGHRPSVGPDQPGKDVDLLGLGPLARSARDCDLALSVLGGPTR